MTQQIQSLSKKRKTEAMPCNAEDPEAQCSCTRCEVISRRLHRKQQLRTLYALPIYHLPPELILKIVDQLDLIEFPAMIIGMFHLLRHHGIAPSMPTADLKIFLKCSNPSPRSRSNSDLTNVPRKGFHCLPIEIRLHIYQHLNARDKINFVLATFHIPTDDIESLTHWKHP